MRSLVVLFALVAVGMAAPSAKTEKRNIAFAYGVPSAVSPVEVAVVAEPVVATRTVAVAPAVYTGASAVSHQSRVDVQHTPGVVTSYSSPVYAPAAAVYSVPSAVSHQSRVDYHTSPALVSQQVVSPAVYDARSVYSPSVYSSSVYSPSVYSPSVYTPSVYSHSAYAPSVYASYW